MPDTLTHTIRHGIEIKRSRFLAHAAPIANASAALTFVQQVASADATHNCWAYRHGTAYRSSDDGEPAGTAGRPILAAIDGHGMDQVVVVVTRWFGGTKLGAGGLIRAYGGCAAQCLRQASRQPLLTSSLLTVHCHFDDLGTVHAALNSGAAEKLDERFNADGAELHLRLPQERLNALKTRLRDATGDRVRYSEPPTA
ncbi:YigZ family protein [Xanthomonas sp. GPE 39]|uniref:IMPACT family protein n=1 Tax=Xanthomonas sp. GPE 39 TaxID=1583099 RepID=UPI0005F2CC1C|nr:YigZ family protein [Xanthomonas sp. GPE 39]